MFILLGYLSLTLIQHFRQYQRRRRYTDAMLRALRTGSVLVQRGKGSGRRGSSAGGGLLSSSLLTGSSSYKELELLCEDELAVSSVNPRQRVDLSDWTSYLDVHPANDSEGSVEVLLEAARPQDMDAFLARAVSVPLANQVHVLKHGCPMAWRSGTPFGIILHCSHTDFVLLCDAFGQGCLTLDEDLELFRLMTVTAVGKPQHLKRQSSESALSQTSADLPRPLDHTVSQSSLISSSSSSFTHPLVHTSPGRGSVDNVSRTAPFAPGTPSPAKSDSLIHTSPAAVSATARLPVEAQAPQAKAEGGSWSLRSSAGGSHSSLSGQASTESSVLLLSQEVSPAKSATESAGAWRDSQPSLTASSRDGRAGSVESGSLAGVFRSSTQSMSASGDWKDSRQSLSAVSGDWKDSRQSLSAAVSEDWKDSRQSLSASEGFTNSQQSLTSMDGKGGSSLPQQVSTPFTGGGFNGSQGVGEQRDDTNAATALVAEADNSALSTFKPPASSSSAEKKPALFSSSSESPQAPQPPSSVTTDKPLAPRSSPPKLPTSAAVGSNGADSAAKELKGVSGAGKTGVVAGTKAPNGTGAKAGNGADTMVKPGTKASVEAGTKAATDASTKVVTSAVTKAATDASTKTATSSATKAATDASTKAATTSAAKAATITSTTLATSSVTKAATVASTKAANGASTKVATDISTKAANGSSTKAANGASTKAANGSSTKAGSDAAKSVGGKASGKPPNVVVYCGNKDTARKFETIRAGLEQCLNTDAYAIYLLPHEHFLSAPWEDNSALLLVAHDYLHDNVGKKCVDFLLKGGRVISFGSSMEAEFVQRKEVQRRPSVEKFKVDKWKDVSAIQGRYHYMRDHLKKDNSSLEAVVTDTKSGHPLVVQLALSARHNNGRAIFSQLFLERDPAEMATDSKSFGQLKQSNKERLEVMRYLLSLLGLDTSVPTPPALTPCYMLAQEQSVSKSLLDLLAGRMKQGIIKSRDLSLKFVSTKAEAGALKVTADTLPVVTDVTLTPGGVKALQFFDPEVYWSHLSSSVFGRLVFYTDVIPSNMGFFEGIQFSIPENLGVIAIAGRQTSGKGRGGNAWLSPVGSAMYTLPVQVPMDSSLGQRVSYIQHLAAFALVHSIRSMPGYQDLDLRLKWPNDVYYGDKMKIGGVLVTSTVMGKTMHATMGCGVNVSNSQPTICINDCIQQHNRDRGSTLRALSTSEVVARAVSALEVAIRRFQTEGHEDFCQQYYKYWLHSGTKVKVESEGNAEVEIVGLDGYGFLRVRNDKGQTISLQPEGNSFDMMRNLIALKRD